ncbi:MAG: hypothetical protein K2Q18_10435 [Bdellovibrionales bacterium]|nr:hypothetical protein [Bdellovibrionales bacterium]
MNSKFLHTKYLAVLLLGIVILLLVSFDAFSETINIGKDAPLEMDAIQSIYRTETSYESYESTCSREVATGSRTTCSPGRSETRCRKVAGVGEECWQETTEENCSEETTYSTEYYSCTETRAVYNDVYDHAVRAKVFITKGDSANDFDLSACTLSISMNDSSEALTANCDKAIVKAKVVSRKEMIESGDKYRDIKLELDFASIEGLGALKKGLSALSFSKGVVSFASANLKEATNFKLTAKLVRNRLLLKDKVLLERELKANEYVVDVEAGGTFKVSIDLAKLTGFDSTKRHDLKIELKTLKAVDVKGAINSPELKNALSKDLRINE